MSEVGRKNSVWAVGFRISMAIGCKIKKNGEPLDQDLGFDYLKTLTSIGKGSSSGLLDWWSFGSYWRSKESI